MANTGRKAGALEAENYWLYPAHPNFVLGGLGQVKLIGQVHTSGTPKQQKQF